MSGRPAHQAAVARRGALACAVLAALLSPLTVAQVPAVAPSPAGKAAPPPVPPGPVPYKDRVIAAEQLQALPPDEDEAADVDFSGPPRSLRVDLGLSRNARGPVHYDEAGVTAAGFWESERWGGFSLDGGLFHSDRARENGGRGIGGTVTLWQRDLALDGGWRVDNGLGVLNTPVLPLQRAQYRFLLPSVPLAGISTEWRDDAHHAQVQAAFGRAGAYTGTRAVGFDAADGRVASLGAQWQWAPGWTGAAAYLATVGRIQPGRLGEPVLQPGNTRALHLATEWAVGGDSLQFNLLGSDGDRGGAEGAWIDGEALRGRYLHNYGVFRLEPGLGWGAYPIQNDVEGAYGRTAYQYGRWSWTAGAEALRTLSGVGDATQYATGYLRYQATSTLGYGGGLNVRHADAWSHSGQLFADKRTAWGQTRAQLDEARANGNESWQLSVDHAFALQQGARLSASAAVGHLHDAATVDVPDGGSTRTVTLALIGGRELTDRLAIDGTARWTRGDGRDAVRGLDLNLVADWRIAARWSLNAALFQSRGSRRSPFVLDPLATGTPYIALPRERSMLLSLRYDYHAGSPRAVIGGAPGAAFGRVSGSVFLDENGDGVRAASELPAPNVTVVLDGRYSVRTDSAGRYEFPRVAVGTHTLAAEPDNLPLPWSFEATPTHRVEVTVRGDVRTDLPAQRPR